jgi:hypothetical protein
MTWLANSPWYEFWAHGFWQFGHWSHVHAPPFDQALLKLGRQPDEVGPRRFWLEIARA